MSEFDEMSENLDDLLKEGLGIFAKFRESMKEYKAEYLKYLLPTEPKAILDFGCGSGLYTPYLKKYFPNTMIYGCDISSKSIEVAKGKYPEYQFSVISSVDDLVQYKGIIDCVFINCVLHHMPPTEHEKWITGISNNMRKGASLIIFEMNMINPLVRNLGKKHQIDKNATMLKSNYCKRIVEKCFNGGEVKLCYSYFFPWRNKLFVGVEHKLGWLPLGAQYYVVAKKNTVKLPG
jgi:2-polyprenyl-3-methyl-5-hydroxy-6-metoxy-1,4-benzoquinol methylase